MVEIVIVLTQLEFDFVGKLRDQAKEDKLYQKLITQGQDGTVRW